MVVNTYMLNPAAWNLAGKSGFVWAGTSAVVWITCYFGLPELKGKSYREIDILFARKVSARNFGKTKIEEEDDD
jgi:SP family general alpha glucoside:H+ symporter-like MFS transporter